MPITIGKYAPIATEEESYATGFKTGQTWTHKHRPGGPFVYSAFAVADKDWKTFAEQSKKNNAAWIRGWEAGLLQRDI